MVGSARSSEAVKGLGFKGVGDTGVMQGHVGKYCDQSLGCRAKGFGICGFRVSGNPYIPVQSSALSALANIVPVKNICSQP